MASLLCYPTSNQETCQNKLSMKCLRTEKIDFVSKALKNISEYYELLGPLIWYFNVNSGHVYISLLTVEGWVKIIKIKLFSIFGQWICSEMLMQHSGTALYGFILWPKPTCICSIFQMYIRLQRKYKKHSWDCKPPPRPLTLWAVFTF